MNGAQRVILGAWLAMVGLATVRALGQGKGLPQPSVFLASGVLFTLYFGAASIPQLGNLVAVFAVGTDVAAVALPYFKGGKSGPLDSLAGGLQKISGGTPASAAPAPGGGGSTLITP